jgi:broad specificity phosphatase PhoE
LTWAEITARHPALAEAPDIIAAYRPPGGETLADVTRRWDDFYTDLVRSGIGRALVVTHAGMLHAIVRAARPRGAEVVTAGRFRFLPASLTRLRFVENDASAIALNDARHLEENSQHWLEAERATAPDTKGP